MRIGVLGTLDGPSGLSGVRLRGLLARLALEAGRPVSAATLVEDLWEIPPDNALNALQALVSRLRRVLGSGLVVTEPGGYRLAVEPGVVDAMAFDALLTEAAQAPPATAHTLLGDALALWRGPALADLGELPFAGPVATRLSERRALAVEERARLALRLGLGPDLDALTTQLTAAPLRETTAALLGRALHAVGRQADALATLDRTIAGLADELGVDPGPELAAARMAVLRALPPSPRTAGLSSFVGRTADVDRIRGLLRTARLVTLTGPGGAGKTRLAREATFVPGGIGRRGHRGAPRVGSRAERRRRAGRAHRRRTAARHPARRGRRAGAAPRRGGGPRPHNPPARRPGSPRGDPRAGQLRAPRRRGRGAHRVAAPGVPPPARAGHQPRAPRRARRGAASRRCARRGRCRGPLQRPRRGRASGLCGHGGRAARRHRDLPPPRRPTARHRAGRGAAAHAVPRGDRGPPRRPVPPAHHGSAHRAAPPPDPARGRRLELGPAGRARARGGPAARRVRRWGHPHGRGARVRTRRAGRAHLAGRQVPGRRRPAGRRPDPLPHVGDHPRLRGREARRGSRARRGRGRARRLPAGAGRGGRAAHPRPGAAEVAGPVAGRGRGDRSRAPPGDLRAMLPRPTAWSTP